MMAEKIKENIRDYEIAYEYSMSKSMQYEYNLEPESHVFVFEDSSSLRMVPLTKTIHLWSIE